MQNIQSFSTFLTHNLTVLLRGVKFCLGWKNGKCMDRRNIFMVYKPLTSKSFQLAFVLNVYFVLTIVRMSCCILSVIYSRPCSSNRCNVFDIFGWIHMPFHILHKGRLFESRAILFTLKKRVNSVPRAPHKRGLTTKNFDHDSIKLTERNFKCSKI